MAIGVNKVILVGRLGRDPEVKYTKSGKAVVNFSIATTEKWGGEDHTEWHNLVAWDKLAEVCGEYLFKGSLVYVEGSLRTRSWEKGGEKRYATDVHVRNMQMLGNGDEKKEEKGYSPREETYPQREEQGPVQEDDIPF